MAGERIVDKCAAWAVALQDGGTLRMGDESMQQCDQQKQPAAASF